MTRYRDWDELFGYCRYSANPVGRLVLYCAAIADAERQRLSDATCTALQLANFWQDVTVDLRKDRVYIPLEIMERHGYTVEELSRAPLHARVSARSCARSSVRRASCFTKACRCRGWWTAGWRSIIDLFSRGGMRVLDKIEQQDYDVLAAPPGHLQSRARGPAARVAWRAWRSPGRRDDVSVEQSYAYLPAHRPHPRQEFLLLVPAALRASSATPCAPSTPSCATATT